MNRFTRWSLGLLTAVAIAVPALFSAGCATSAPAKPTPREPVAVAFVQAPTYSAFSLSAGGHTVVNDPGNKFVERDGVRLAGVTDEKYHHAFSVDTSGNVFGYVQMSTGTKSALWPAGVTSPILPGKGNGILGTFNGAYVIQTGNGNFGLLSGQTVVALASPTGTKPLPRGVSFDGTRLRGALLHLLPSGPETEASWKPDGAYVAVP